MLNLDVFRHKSFGEVQIFSFIIISSGIYLVFKLRGKEKCLKDSSTGSCSLEDKALPSQLHLWICGTSIFGVKLFQIDGPCLKKIGQLS